MSDYDRDPAADDADLRVEVSDLCRRSEHDGFDGEKSGCSGYTDRGVICGCECHDLDIAEPQNCPRCKQPPPGAEAYKCRRCGAEAEVNPYPTIGCACTVATYTCDVCLRKRGA